MLARFTRLPDPRVLGRIAAGMTLAGVMLFLLSLSLSWWGLIMYAPQYPGGLEMITSLSGLSGDVGEIDELNHYIGMMKLNDAAKLERSAAPYVVYLSAALAFGALFTRRRAAAWLLRLPLVIFPVFFLIDLKFWLWYAGNHLDPTAPLSATIKGFTPTMLGAGKIAQFQTAGWLEPGFWTAAAGALLALIAGVLSEGAARGGVPGASLSRGQG